MAQDMPWPPKGKQADFTYTAKKMQLKQQVLKSLSIMKSMMDCHLSQNGSQLIIPVKGDYYQQFYLRNPCSY